MKQISTYRYTVGEVRPSTIKYLRPLIQRAPANLTLAEKTNHVLQDTPATELIESYILCRLAEWKKERLDAAEACVAILVSENWKFTLSHKITLAVSSLTNSFHTSKTQGYIRLTSASLRIGGAVLPQTTDGEPYPEEGRLVIGNLFVEAFYNLGYVGLEREFMTKADATQQAPHIITMNENTRVLADIHQKTTVLSGTSLEKPPNTSSRNKRTWIDNNTESPNTVFHNVIKRTSGTTHIDTQAPWVRALDRQQQTRLRVNTCVLEAVRSHEALFLTGSIGIEDRAEKAALNSKLLAASIVLNKATRLKEADHFYPMIDVDYRGRYYHIESFMNFQGSDLARGMIEFANGVKMTEEGEFWLAVHVASSYNPAFGINDNFSWTTGKHDYKAHMESKGLDTIALDKMALVDRAKWTYNNEALILNCGTNKIFPHKINEDSSVSFDAEKPVQFLAACIEWANYYEHGRNFITHLPISIDGSNNGWQHLAAFSKDKQAANLVGIEPTDIPTDFYLSTAQEMIATLNDVELSAIIEKMNMREIRKGLSKRGSMTRAYSAGTKAIATNMWSDMKQMGYHKKFMDFDKLTQEFIDNGEADSYAVEVRQSTGTPTFSTLDAAHELANEICQTLCTKFAKVLIQAIATVCPGPLETMGWLQELVKQAAGTFRWENEDGEPVATERAHHIERRRELNSNFKRDFMGNLVTNKHGASIRIPLTPEELMELNNISKTLDSYVFVKVEGEGQQEITWTTPSGFNAAYTKRFSFARQVPGIIKGYGNNGRIWQTINLKSEHIDVSGFVSSITPNLVHSFDAAHMALTIDDFGKDFLGIHDSYSTHASNVNSLLASTKKCFINMYRDKNMFESMQNQLLNKPEEWTAKNPLNPGNLDVSIVKGSSVFFS